MIFSPTSIVGVFLITPDRFEDERGWFARTWCHEEFKKHGLPDFFPQCSASFNKRRGTLRGMHMQAAPYAEAKLVRCTRGAVYDVALDMREDSPTRYQWTAAELTAENGHALFIPEGVAHGFQTLRDETEIFYHISTPYRAEAARSWRWSDPAFGIAWPEPEIAFLSPRDAEVALLKPSTGQKT